MERRRKTKRFISALLAFLMMMSWMPGSALALPTYAEETAVPEETPEPTETAVSEETPEPAETAVPEETPEPAETAVPEETPEPTETAVPEETPEPTETAVPEETPAPTETAVPEETPEPTETPEPEPTAVQQVQAMVDALTVDTVTEDMIQVPTGLYYDGTDQTARIQNETKLMQNDQEVTAEGWTFSVTKVDELHYTVTYTQTGTENKVSKDVFLEKSGTVLTALLEDGQTEGTYNYSDEITITVTVSPSGAVPAMLTTRAGDGSANAGEVKVFAPADSYYSADSAEVTLDAAGRYVHTFTLDKWTRRNLAVGENTVKIKYSGCEFMAEAETTVTITMNPCTHQFEPNGQCEWCGIRAKASVVRFIEDGEKVEREEKYYLDMEEAWAAACAAYDPVSGVPVTFSPLGTVPVNSTLTLSNGEKIELYSYGGGISGDASLSGPVVRVTNGELILGSNTTIVNAGGNGVEVSGNGTFILNEGIVAGSNTGVQISGGSFIMNSGTLGTAAGITSSCALEVSGETTSVTIYGSDSWQDTIPDGTILEGTTAVHLTADATVTINGGTFSGTTDGLKADTVLTKTKLTGGTFSRVEVTGGAVDSLLETDYAYYKDSTKVADATAAVLDGPVSVMKDSDHTTNGLDLRYATSDQGDLDGDGYHWDAGSKTLTMKDCTVAGNVLLPSGEGVSVKIDVQGDSYVDGDIKCSDGSGSGPAVVIDLTIEGGHLQVTGRIGDSGSNDIYITIAEGANVTAGGGVKTGASGGVGGSVTVNGTLHATGNLDFAPAVTTGGVIIGENGVLTVSGRKGVSVKGDGNSIENAFDMKGGTFSANCSDYNIILDASPGYLENDGWKTAFTFPKDCIYIPDDYKIEHAVAEYNGIVAIVKDSTPKSALLSQTGMGGSLLLTRYYTVTVDKEHIDGGTVTASHTHAAKDQTVTLTLTPADGYYGGVPTVTAGNESVDVRQEEGKYTFLMPASDVTVTANFVEKTSIADDSTISVALENRTYTYTGREHRPSVTVMKESTPLTKGSTLLTEGTDYTVAYSNNTNAGEATVTITGKGTYTGTRTETFHIDQATLTITGATLETREYEQNNVNATVTDVTFDGIQNSESLTLGTDYTATAIFEDDNAGQNKTATVTVTLPDNSNYAFADGVKTAQYILTGQTINRAIMKNVRADGYTGTYDGNAHGITIEGYPSGVTVRYGTEDGTYNLTENPAYTDAGTYKVYYRLTSNNYETVTGSATVTIDRKDVTVSITANGGVYSGRFFPASATLEDVVENENVTVTLTYIKVGETTGSTTAPTNVGNYTVTATITDNNYNLTGLNTKDFTITPKSIEGANVTVDGSYTYTGAAHTPVLTVTLGNETLTRDIDYSVSYAGNVNAGTAAVTVTGIGNYTDEAAGTFTIGKAVITDISTTMDSVKVPNAQGTVQSEVEDGSGYNAVIVWEPADSTYDFNTAYTATLTLTPDKNHVFEALSRDGWSVTVGEDGIATLTKTFSATRKERITSLDTGNISDFTLEAHTGKEGVIAKLPTTVNAATETGKTVSMKLNWSCEDFNAAPNYKNTFTWTVTDVGSYDASGVILSGSITVTNPDALPVNITKMDKEVTYNGGTIDVSELFTIDENAGAASYTITGGTGEGTLNGSTLTVTRAGIFTITVHTAVEGIYADGTAEAILTVNKGTGTGSVTIEDWTYGDTAEEPVPESDTNGNDNVTYTYALGDETVALLKNAGTYTVTATFEETDLYNGCTASAEFTIAPKPITVTIMPNGGVYGGEITGAAAVPNDVVTGDTAPTVTLTYTGKANDGTEVNSTDVPTNAGTYTVTASINSSNYTLTGTVTARFQVNRAESSLTVAEVAEKTYGDEDFTLEVTADAGRNVRYVSSNPAVVAVDETGKVHIVGAGEATIIVSLEEVANFLGKQLEASVKVARKPIRVIADSAEMTYGEPVPDMSYTVTTEDLIGEDTLTGITVTRQKGEDAGEYIVTLIQEAGANPNYDVELAAGKLTIQPKDIGNAKIVLGPALIANGKEQTQKLKSVTVKNSKGEAMEVTYTVTGNTAVNAGGYTMTITGTGNFTGTKEQSFVIAPGAGQPVETDDSSPDTATGTAPQTGASSPNTATGTTPQAGDSSRVDLWLAMMTISALGLGIVLNAYRKKKRIY